MMCSPRERRALHAAAFAALLTVGSNALNAQQLPAREGAVAESNAPRWIERVALSVRVGQLQPSGNSELYALLDRALAPGANALHPTLVGGALHVRLRDRWDLVAGVESGDRTVSSTSLVQVGGSAARQQTRLDVASQQYVGVEWRAWQWGNRSNGEVAGHERLRLLVGAGIGSARYRLRQWGDFVDVSRSVTYADDFRSSGRGALAYFGATAEAPVRRWASLRVELRHQRASAPMSGDYSGFDRLDLGGTSALFGIRIQSTHRQGAH